MIFLHKRTHFTNIKANIMKKLKIHILESSDWLHIAYCILGMFQLLMTQNNQNNLPHLIIPNSFLSAAFLCIFLYFLHSFSFLLPSLPSSCYSPLYRITVQICIKCFFSACFLSFIFTVLTFLLPFFDHFHHT